MEPEDKPPINPLKQLRIKLNITTNEQMSQLAGINVAAICQQEDGFFRDIIPAYLAALRVPIASQDEFELIKDYQEWQTVRRQWSGSHNILVRNPIFSLIQNPLYSWRIQSSVAVYGLCRNFCIHMPTVNKFEKDMNLSSQIPPVILLALQEAGYDTEEFEEACKLFKVNYESRIMQLNNLAS